jgi:hypothetical protein
MRKIFQNVVFVFISFIIISCGSGRIENLERKPNEAIVIAKMKIIDEEYDITQESEIFFSKEGVSADAASYVYFKIPCGRNNISRIETSYGSQNLQSYLLRYLVPESKIYYIGDISLKFDISANWQAIAFGLLGNWAYENRDVENPEVDITDNFESAKTHFKNLFPNNEEIYKSIAVFDTLNIKHPSDTLSKSEKRRKMK